MDWEDDTGAETIVVAAILPFDGQSGADQKLLFVSLFQCLSGEGVSSSRAVTQTKFEHGRIRKSSFPEIGDTNVLSFGCFVQCFRKVVGGIRRNHHHALPVVIAMLLFWREFTFLDLYPIFLSDIFQRFGIGHVFVFHDKGDGITAFATAETFEEPFSWRDNERWSLFIVKRTACHIVRATLFQCNKITHYIDDVGCCKNSIYGLSVNHD